VVTTSGGSGILAADACEAHGLRLARFSPPTQALLDDVVPAYGATANPVDVTATVMSDATLFDRTLDAISGDDGVDMVVACFCVLTGKDVDDVVSSLARAAQRSGKPVLAARTGAAHLAPSAGARLREAGIPTYPTPARAVRAAAALHQVSQAAATRQVSLPGATRRRVAPERDTWRGGPAGISENELKALLAGAGLPVPSGRLVRDGETAAVAVDDVGGLAVMKAVVPGLTHKTEAGGVALGVTPQTAAQTFERLAALGGQVLVEEMVPDGVEALVGVTTSPLGPVLTVGLGGVLTEVLDDVALRLLPVCREQVEQMLDETRLAALLAGVRGTDPADRGALVDAVTAVTSLVDGWPPGFELDLNPVRVLAAGQGVRVLDAAYIAPQPDVAPEA
jgi:acyl-CoA synthetase (NDP forming)